MKVWSVSAKNIRSITQKASALLKKGKVIVCPTDTVYGLLADAGSKEAVRRIFLIKGRKQGKPLPIFVQDVAMAKKLAKVSPTQEKYMKKVWPGKVTVVLESRGVLPKETGTSGMIGLRIPKHKLAQEILRRLKKPVTGTSANLSGRPSLSDSKDVISQFQRRKHAPDIVLDAGKLPFSKPSKVIDITAFEPRVVRS